MTTASAMPGEVGYTGDVDALREYPCNCFSCRGRLSAVAECHGDAYHDGELTWWRCVFCERYFDWEGMELLSGGQQACERCAEGWMQRCRASVPSDAVENNEQPAPPGALSVA